MSESWSILFTEQFKGDLKRLEKAGVNPFLQSLSFLKAGPHLNNNKLKPMKVASKAFRWRRGNLRVIFRLISNKKEVLLLRAGQRQSIYNKVVAKTQTAVGKLEELIRETETTDESIEIAPQVETLQLFPLIDEESIVEEIFIDQADLHLLDIPVEYHDELMICETIEEASKLKLPKSILARIEDYITSPQHDHVGKIYGLDNVDNLEDIASQSLAKFLVKLDPQQSMIVNKPFSNGPLLIRGGPGTGKTLINLARIRKTFDKEVGKSLFSFSAKTVAFVTFNKSLSHGAREMYGEISRENDTNKVDFFTLDSFVYQNSKDPLDIAFEATKLKMLDECFNLSFPQEFNSHYRADFKKKNNLGYIIEEFEEVIQARDLSELEYINTDGHRIGRRKKLGRKQKSLIWFLFKIWKNKLKDQGLTTFPLRRLNLLKSIEDGHLPVIKYDFVFVDELQDLSVVSIRILTHLVKNIKNLTFTADTAQSIYLKAPTWSNIHSSLKFNRSNSFILRQSYRMTKEISNAISPLRANSGDAEKDNDGIQNALYSGPKPFWINTPEANHFYKTVEIIKNHLDSSKVNPSQVAVIVSINKEAEEIKDLLLSNGVKSKLVNGKEKIDMQGKHVHVLTVQAAKGLEFPFVVVPKVVNGRYPNYIALKHCSSLEEQEEQKDKAKRLLYVALSRAARTLWMLTDRANPCEFLDELSPEAWDVRGS